MKVIYNLYVFGASSKYFIQFLYRILRFFRFFSYKFCSAYRFATLINKIIEDKLIMEGYKPKKLKSPVKAIREKCIECMGGRGTGQNYNKLIKECASPDCPTFEFRFGKNPYHTQNLTDEQRKERSERLKSSLLHDKRSGKVA
jgi:hypothetical protein